MVIEYKLQRINLTDSELVEDLFTRMGKEGWELKCFLPVCNAYKTDSESVRVAVFTRQKIKYEL